MTGKHAAPGHLESGKLTHRVDSSSPVLEGGIAWDRPLRAACFVALAFGFVLLGGASLDLGPIESRLGLTAFETPGPLGRALGGWEPSVWPGRLLPSLAWAWGEGGTPTSASVRWPAAIAAVLTGLILVRRSSDRLGGRAGVLVGLCWFGSIGLMDRSAGAGLDLIAGLLTVAALDRLIGKGSDLVAGAYAALAFLAGGWPPLAVVALTTVVLGRSGATLSWRLLVPPSVAAVGWSAWAISSASSEAWAAALALPLTQKVAWGLAPGVLLLGLPWSPLAALTASRGVRGGWDSAGRSLVVGWLQVVGVCLLAGTLVPGLATAARVPALAGMALAAGAACDRLLAGRDGLSAGAGRWAFGVVAGLSVVWLVGVALAGGYLAAAVPYYRTLSVVLIIAGVPLAALGVTAALRRDSTRAVFALIALSVCLKAGHWGYYVPEWNYRRSQGPWGRAVGQWVPPHWPIYTTHSWPADFAFATGRPFRQLLTERHLAYQPDGVKFVLLLDSEFEHWPEHAPPITRVAGFQDESGRGRVLARTPGDLPWAAAARSRAHASDE